MNVQTLTTRMHAEGLRLNAQFAKGEYHCAITRDGAPVSQTNDPTLHGAVLSALYAAPMAHILTPQADAKIVLV